MKICPKCGEEHAKNGIFCSRICANSRTWSDQDKKKKSISAKEFYNTEAGVLRKREQSELAKNQICSEETRQKMSDTRVGMIYKKRIKKDDDVVSRRKGRVKTLEEKKKLSIAAKKRNFGGNTSKTKLYFLKKDGQIVYLQSSYEIRFAEFLERLNIEWERPPYFKWIDEQGEDHRYYPDFRIGSIFIDTKNDYLAIKDLPKITAVKIQNNIDLRIVTNDMINEEYIASLV